MDIIHFSLEHLKYAKYTKDLFWYHKYSGKEWIKGQNFGDYLSKVVIGELLCHKKSNIVKKMAPKKLLAIGSIIHFAKDDDIVWGSGINGKVDDKYHCFKSLDIRLLRGPLSKEYLKKNHNIEYRKELYADPAVLIPHFFPDFIYKPKKNKITVIPNLNEYEEVAKIIPRELQLISPLLHWKKVLKEMLESEVVYTSSLHGFIMAEVFEVPVFLFKPFGGETMFKYNDYIEGTKRIAQKTPKTFLEGFKEENALFLQKSPIFSSEEIVDSFPRDLLRI